MNSTNPAFLFRRLALRFVYPLLWLRAGIFPHRWAEKRGATLGLWSRGLTLSGLRPRSLLLHHRLTLSGLLLHRRLTLSRLCTRRLLLHRRLTLSRLCTRRLLLHRRLTLSRLYTSRLLLSALNTLGVP